MAFLCPQLERVLVTDLHRAGRICAKGTCGNGSKVHVSSNYVPVRTRNRCFAVAMEASSSSVDMASVRWGSTCLQGAREEMEDEIILRVDSLNGFSFAAVLDGHGGDSSVKYLRENLYKGFSAALQNGLLLKERNFDTISASLSNACAAVDETLLTVLEINGVKDESGSTATVMLIGHEMIYISHLGDSAIVVSRSGVAKTLTMPHRPCGNSKSSLEEIRRIRKAGGWIVNGRICGDIAVSRAFGDTRFKTKKIEMLQNGVDEGRWSEKFASRVKFNGDLVVSTPDNFQVPVDSDLEFVLLASDGLWDYMSSSEAVTFVRNQLRKHGDVQIACEKLAQAALDRRSQDNISIIIADLGRTEWKTVPMKQENVFFELGQAFATVGLVVFGIWISSQLSLNL